MKGGGSQSQRRLIGFSDDEDSHNYVEDESDALTVEEGNEPYEYSIKDSLMDFLYSKRVFFSLLAVLCLVTAIFTWNVKIDTRDEADEEKVTQRGVGLGFMFSGMSVSFGVILDFILEHLSLLCLKRGGEYASATWYYISELSSYIAAAAVVVGVQIFLMFSYGNFHVIITNTFRFYCYSMIRTALITIILLSALKVGVQKISMSFNYNLYINRIKKCILFDFFINLITNIREDETGPQIRVSFDESDSEDARQLDVDGSGLGTIIFQKKFRAKDLGNLSLAAKRLLLKEFRELVKNTMSYSGSQPVVFGKIRLISTKKANKLFRQLVRTDEIRKMGDLGQFFKDQKIFDYFLKQLDLERDEKLEKANIARIIEKAHREIYAVNKSLEQINSAIDKLAFCGRIVICISALIGAYISSTVTDKENSLATLISTFVGSQIFNRIVSDHVINSIIFLFIIHPFDISDRVLIKLDGTEENLVVAELNVFSTQFYRWDGTSVFIPNHVLHGNPITNLRRSGPLVETLSIQIDSSTDPGKLYVLKKMLLEFVREHSEIYTDYIMVNHEKIENSNKLFIKVLLQYQTNRQNHESYLKKRSFFIIELNRCLRSLGITYNLPVQRINLHPATARRLEGATEGDIE